MFEVQELDVLTEFDEKLWLTIIDTVTIHADGRMIFKFQSGTEIDAYFLTNMKAAGLNRLRPSYLKCIFYTQDLIFPKV